MECWYVVYIKVNNEKRVAAQLARRKIPFFLPADNVFHSAKKKTESSDFKSLCFVNLQEENLKILKLISGICNIVYWLNKPVVVKELDVNIIQHFFDISDCHSIHRIPVSSDEPVSILNLSPGEESNTEIKLNLPTLGYSIIGEIAYQSAAFTIKENIAV